MLIVLGAFYRPITRHAQESGSRNSYQKLAWLFHLVNVFLMIVNLLSNFRWIKLTEATIICSDQQRDCVSAWRCIMPRGDADARCMLPRQSSVVRDRASLSKRTLISGLIIKPISHSVTAGRWGEAVARKQVVRSSRLVSQCLGLVVRGSGRRRRRNFV